MEISFCVYVLKKTIIISWDQKKPDPVDIWTVTSYRNSIFSFELITSPWGVRWEVYTYTK